MYTPPEEETKRKETDKKKNPLTKIGDGDQADFEVLGALVRVGVLIWSGAILTLTYVQVPGLPQQKIDPTFIASIFTGALATFGVQSQRRDNSKPDSKKDDAKAS